MLLGLFCVVLTDNSAITKRWISVAAGGGFATPITEGIGGGLSAAHLRVKQQQHYKW